jgi:hypothetical protein
MVNKAHGLDRLGIVQSDGEGALIGTHFTASLVAVLKNVFARGVTQHIHARVSRDLFGAIAPKDDPSLQIEDADADLQVIEDVAVNVWIFESRHGDRNVGRNAAYWLSIGSVRTLLKRGSVAGSKSPSDLFAEAALCENVS